MGLIYTNTTSRKRKTKSKFGVYKKREYSGKPYTPEESVSYVRGTDHRDKYPSMGDGFGQRGDIAAKKESYTYSGEYITGLATMHKSNIVPVGRGDRPADYSTMRRS